LDDHVFSRRTQAAECALQTIRTNLIKFADRYPADTTTGNVYYPRQARNGFGEGANYGWDDRLLAGRALAGLTS
jgi:hypothetical protein